jgi:hypothetical protein
MLIFFVPSKTDRWRAHFFWHSLPSVPILLSNIILVFSCFCGLAIQLRTLCVSCLIFQVGKEMPSFSVIFLWHAFELISTLCVMSSFSRTDSSLCCMPVSDVAMQFVCSVILQYVNCTCTQREHKMFVYIFCTEYPILLKFKVKLSYCHSEPHHFSSCRFSMCHEVVSDLSLLKCLTVLDLNFLASR